MFKGVILLIIIAAILTVFCACASTVEKSELSTVATPMETTATSESTLPPIPEPTPEPTPLPILTANGLFNIDTYGLVKLYHNGEFGTKGIDFDWIFKECNGKVPENFLPVLSDWSNSGFGLIYDSDTETGKLLINFKESFHDDVTDEYVDVGLKSADFCPGKKVIDFGMGQAHFIALFEDGTISAELIEDTPEYYRFGQENIDELTNANAVAAGASHSLVLKQDGTVKAYGSNENKQCEVDNWTDIIAIEAGRDISVGLKSDGKVVVTKPGQDQYGFEAFDSERIEEWDGIKKIATCTQSNDTLIVGLKEDGTIVVSGKYATFFKHKYTSISWSSESFGQDIIDIAVYDYTIYALDKTGQTHIFNRHNHYLYTSPWQSGATDICEYVDSDILFGRKTDKLATWSPLDEKDVVEDMETVWEKLEETSAKYRDNEYPKVSIIRSKTIYIDGQNRDHKGKFYTEIPCVNVQAALQDIYCLLENGNLLILSTWGSFEDGKYSPFRTQVVEDFVDMDEYVTMVSIANDLVVLYKSGQVISFRETSDLYTDYSDVNWDRWKEGYPEISEVNITDITPEQKESIITAADDIYNIVSTNYAFEKTSIFEILSDDYEHLKEIFLSYFGNTYTEDNRNVYSVQDNIRGAAYLAVVMEDYYDDDREYLDEPQLGASNEDVLDAAAYAATNVDIPIVLQLISDLDHPQEFEIFVELAKKMRWKIVTENSDSVTIQTHTLERLLSDIWEISNNRFILELSNNHARSNYLVVTREYFE